MLGAQALAAQMAAVAADAEWLEPDERDAVIQLLRAEYMSESDPPPPPPPPPPSPAAAARPSPAAAPQNAQLQKEQQQEQQRGRYLPAAGGGGPLGEAAQPEAPAEPRAKEKSQQQRDAVLAEAAAQMAAARAAAARQLGESVSGNKVPAMACCGHAVTTAARVASSCPSREGITATMQ